MALVGSAEQRFWANVYIGKVFFIFGCSFSFHFSMTI